jgi:uncharacterized cupin superfamily protein
MTFATVALNIPASELEESLLGQPTAEPIDGPITVRKQVFLNDTENGITSGTWECEPGRSRWEFVTRGEVVQIIAGRMTVTEDGKEPVELTAGTTAIYPIGWKGVWEVHETIRKVFVIFQKR